MSIEQRIERLEKSAARWRMLAVGAIALFSVALVASQPVARWWPGEAIATAADSPVQKFDVLQVKKLQVLGQRGEEVIALEAGTTGGSMIVRSTNQTGAFVAMFDGEAGPLVGISGPKASVNITGGSLSVATNNPEWHRAMDRLAPKIKAGKALTHDEQSELLKPSGSQAAIIGTTESGGYININGFGDSGEFSIAFGADGPTLSIDGPVGRILIDDRTIALAAWEPEKRRTHQRLRTKQKTVELAPDERDEFAEASKLPSSLQLRAMPSGEGGIGLTNSRRREVVSIGSTDANSGVVFTRDASGALTGGLPSR